MEMAGASPKAPCQADEVEIARGGGDGFLHRRLHRRLPDGRARRQEAIGAEEEHAAVPEIFARGEIALGRRRIRLLDEGRHLAAARRIRQRLAAPDIAIARLRRAGRDAEGDQRSASAALAAWRTALRKAAASWM